MYFGISPSKFDELVMDGRYAAPPQYRLSKGAGRSTSWIWRSMSCRARIAICLPVAHGTIDDLDLRRPTSRNIETDTARSVLLSPTRI